MITGDLLIWYEYFVIISSYQLWFIVFLFLSFARSTWVYLRYSDESSQLSQASHFVTGTYEIHRH